MELALDDGDPEAIRARMSETMAAKKRTQPVRERTAGCVFKNPEGQSAGMLLDRAGFKGYRLGDMGFSPLHANFLVNLGGGKAEHALELLELARSTVRERFGLELETEVRVIT